MDAIRPEWFRAQLAAARQNQASLARYMGVDPSAVSHMLAGRRGMHLEDVEKIALFLKAPLNAVLDAAGLPVDRIESQKRRVPVMFRLTYPDAALEYEPASETKDENDCPRSDWIESPIPVPRDAFAIQSPFARDCPWAGWTLFAVRSSAVEAAAIGHLSYCETERTERGAVPVLGTPQPSHKPGCFAVTGLTGEKRDLRLHGATPIMFIKP